jgi:hypothetical protein
VADQELKTGDPLANAKQNLNVGPHFDVYYYKKKTIPTAKLL